MKNRIIIIAATIAALAVSCQKEEISTPVVKTEPMVISAGAETKTVLVGDAIYWTSGDEIMVLDNLGGLNVFKDDNLKSNKESASFAGDVTEGTTKFLAIYPSTLVAQSSTYSSTIVAIPAIQTANAESFAAGHNISVAYGNKTPGKEDAGSVNFENICGLLKFSTSLTNITSVSISSNSSALAGNVSVAPNETENGFVANYENCAAKTITMTPATEGDVFPSAEGVTTFWFTLAPVKLTDLTITVTAGGYTYSMKKEWSAESPLEIEAGKYRNLGTIALKQAGVKAEHTYTDNILDGTKLTITLPDEVRTMSLQLSNSNGVVWDEIASLVVTGAKDYSTYPYLPQGEYTLSGTYTTTNGTVVTLGTSTFPVPAPTFTVTAANAYTSYDKYVAKDIDAANNCDALTIYNLHDGVTASISSDLLTKYEYKITTQTPDGEIDGATYQFGATSLGAKEITTCFTFDGVKVSSAAKTYHITGLPYKQLEEAGWERNFKEEAGWFGTKKYYYGLVIWSGNTVMLGNNYSRDKYEDQISSWFENVGQDWKEAFNSSEITNYASATKTFHIPSNVNVNTTVSGSVVAQANKESKMTSFLKWTDYYWHDDNKCLVTVGNQSTSAETKSNHTSNNKTTTKLSNLNVAFDSSNNNFQSILKTDAATAVIHNTNSDGDNMTTITGLQILYRKIE